VHHLVLLIPAFIAGGLAFSAVPTLLAQSEVEKFELVGRIVLPNGEIDTSVRPKVFLQSIRTIFFDQTVASRGWAFRFKGVEAGKYTLFVAAQDLGVSKQTLIIGKSHSDEDNRILIEVRLEPKSASSSEVSVASLTVSDEARSEYQKALECLSRQDREEAIRHLERAVEVAPQYADAWNRLGTISYKAQEYERAEHYFREAIEQDPSSYSPLVNLGAALLLQDRLQEALIVNLEATQRQPDDPLAHAQLGGTYFALGELDKAEHHLKTAKAKDEAHFSNPQLMLAKVYLQQQKYSAAIEEMEDFLRIHPDYPLADRLHQLIDIARKKLKESRGGVKPDP
jgi:Tfp pilus assembly protein PilF